MSLRLNISGVRKSYNGKPVLNACSFSFDRNGVYVLTGSNGSGKSTLLRICALIESPDNGEVIYFSGNNIISKDILLRRRITLVLPGIGLFNTTVFNNAAYGLKIRGGKNKETERKVNNALKFVGLIHKKNHNALTLSSGEIQRLGIARAMAIEPEMLFLDEPTASIDNENTEIVENIILNMKKEGRSKTIIATHDMLQAGRLGDCMLLMDEGKIIKV
ncbi:MAG: ABC transporter ATP-binding protein [Nitrospirae bacterium RIFOXYB2_FULL_43_5]|nr:MAG: ABC transporter ATP-binding protein [Nitrospirae bacterium GWF2_44_13]OGW32291.1 MAG: ABC transporter ATP-binding protein [Nitrospirae bacterium GWD2_44_7]OGW73715.1 MAG: ABC transporter ATP-binding protein [Nitrospirae bacterium RIFOXYC2_FULL_44_7]OGW78192.1 MAG: ABC transporter ATP-binding protein [Nitrospirae bacterium RIFOXYB2_FULL_43_5]HBG93530.1 ABC transporter ATP-binding protein [Nitrospiraceae bacterium]